MKKIEIYTKNYCPYCLRAKELLSGKDLSFIEYDVTDNQALEEEMRRRSGRKTVPEIFIDDSLIGGCDDLFALDQRGGLDSLLKG
jgi:glutaredoxin 3